jgi:hypothetical protein
MDHRVDNAGDVAAGAATGCSGIAAGGMVIGFIYLFITNEEVRNNWLFVGLIIAGYYLLSFVLNAFDSAKSKSNKNKENKQLSITDIQNAYEEVRKKRDNLPKYEPIKFAEKPKLDYSIIEEPQAKDQEFIYPKEEPKVLPNPNPVGDMNYIFLTKCKYNVSDEALKLARNSDVRILESHLDDRQEDKKPYLNMIFDDGFIDISQLEEELMIIDAFDVKCIIETIKENR